ncbi:hypothetical protein ACLB2K_058220 [Fragaria x ananassa]
MEPDDDEEPPEELEPVENPAAEEDPLLRQAQGQFLLPYDQSPPFAPTTGKLTVVRPPVHVNMEPPGLAFLAAEEDPNPNQDPIPDPLIQEAFLVPFLSPAFSPSVGKLNAIRPVVPVSFNDIGPPAAGDFHLLPRGTGTLPHGVRPPGNSRNDVVEPEAGQADTSNDVVEPHLASNDVVVPQALEFLRRLYDFLMLSIDDPDLSSAMEWIDDFTFRVLDHDALATYFGLEIEEFRSRCQLHGIMQIKDDVWRHCQGYLRRGTPEMLQSILLPRLPFTKE